MKGGKAKINLRKFGKILLTPLYNCGKMEYTVL